VRQTSSIYSRVKDSLRSITTKLPGTKLDSLGPMVVADVKIFPDTEKDASDKSGAISLQGLASLRGVRIIVVIGVFDLGGSERQALAVVRYLRDVAGADVEIWGCHAGGGRVAELCRQYYIPCRLMPIPWMAHWGRAQRYKALLQFTLALRRARADVFLPYITLTNVFCGLVWRFTGAKTCIWNQRESGITEPVGPRVGRWATRLTPRFTSNSQHGAEYLINKHNVPRTHVTVLHNAVELSTAELDGPTWRRNLNVSEDSFVAVMLANLHGGKDHATVQKAWQIVANRIPATLLLAGRFDGTQDSLKLLAVDLGITDYVRFLGPVKDVSGLLSASDLAVFSSPAEGCPNAVLECMAAALPVVATDIPGVREAVGPDGIPFLTPFGDAEAMASKILELARNPGLRSKLGKLNRQRIETQFSPRMLGERTCALISSVLERVEVED
jgi:glycosyltransferase involved in cell wall biosynthesis